MQLKSRNLLIKKLLFQAKYRGCRENDIMLKIFVDKHLNSLEDEELKILEKFLQNSDVEIFNWITNLSTSPKYFYKIILKMKIKQIRANETI